ncbi:DUF996 domain-containing protein [Pyrococcus abyssi]|uniref:DUF996 domain-containing protein n=1 Tax=Pyrococcus abyssi (strain GE5 / Orsay) TaxID=272844 RepID=Q9V0G3_PYRAB|nr:DUF996 domain-containing protein [Pyrococcus abyssi]CAB49740.1 Hypothetical protein PAB1809 [Pyrococcus abyssi GE5]CCE70228.1 TPA: hypothetical protein PAB1809 [Pyrococcus abyssi GE5]
MSLSNAKLYGGIGAILQLVSIFAGTYSWLLSIVGLVLVFLAVKIISEEAGDSDIFNYYLKAFISMVAGLLLFFVIIVATAGTAIIKGLKGGMMSPEHFFAILGSILIGFVILWIAYIIGTYFQKKSFELIAQYTDVGLFKTTGLLYFIGAILLIIAIGALILLIGAILEIVAFFSLPDEIKKLERSAVSP